MQGGVDSIFDTTKVSLLGQSKPKGIAPSSSLCGQRSRHGPV